MKAFYIDEERLNIGEDEFLQIYPIDLHQNNSVDKLSTSPDLQSTIITDEIYGDFSIITYLDVLPGI